MPNYVLIAEAAEYSSYTTQHISLLLRREDVVINHDVFGLPIHIRKVTTGNHYYYEDEVLGGTLCAIMGETTSYKRLT